MPSSPKLSFAKRSLNISKCMACTRTPSTRGVAMSTEKILLQIRATHSAMKVARTGQGATIFTETEEIVAVAVNRWTALSPLTKSSPPCFLISIDVRHHPTAVIAPQTTRATNWDKYAWSTIVAPTPSYDVYCLSSARKVDTTARRPRSSRNRPQAAPPG